MGRNLLAGTALHLAHLSIARYCIKIEKLSGSINVSYVIARINDHYGLVSRSDVLKMTYDVENMIHYLKNQKNYSMSRAGYNSFRSEDIDDITNSLHLELIDIIDAA